MLVGCAGTQSTNKVTPVASSVPKAPGAERPGVPAFSDVPDASDAPGDAIAQELASTVKKVTVYSDRARVTRQATAEVGEEPTVFAFRRLPGWVDDGSVRVTTTAGRIVDVRVERNFLARATDEKWLRAEAHHKVLTAPLNALSDEEEVLDAQRAQIESGGLRYSSHIHGARGGVGAQARVASEHQQRQDREDH